MKQQGRKTVLFGAGQICRDILRQHNLSVSCIVDNNASICGKQIKGIPVVHPNDIDNWKESFVMITCRESAEIEIQLRSYGLRKYEDYMLATEVFG